MPPRPAPAPDSPLSAAAPGRFTLIHADWLDAARSLAAAAPQSIDFLYADPPFNTGVTKRAVRARFADRFDSPAAYIAWLRERLLASRPLLKPSASLCIHVDWRTSHHVRLLLDELFGPGAFLNHLIWSYGLGGSSPRFFARKHDDLLWYAASDAGLHYFDPPRIPASSRRMAGQTKKATDVLDIPSINNMAAERAGYPTQKPLALLQLLVHACCPTGGTTLDPTCGSGTTLLATALLNRLAPRALTTPQRPLVPPRHAVGFDLSPDAIALAAERLAALGVTADHRTA